MYRLATGCLRTTSCLLKSRGLYWEAQAGKLNSVGFCLLYQRDEIVVDDLTMVGFLWCYRDVKDVFEAFQR